MRLVAFGMALLVVGTASAQAPVWTADELERLIVIGAPLRPELEAEHRAQAHYLLAVYAQYQRDLRRARAELEAAIAEMPNSSRLRARLGAVWLELNDVRRAESESAAAVEAAILAE